MQFNNLEEFRDGRPIAFVYQEPRHDALFQVRLNKAQPISGDTPDLLWHSLKELGVVLENIIFLTREQIQMADECGQSRFLRPFTEAEKGQLLESKTQKDAV